MENIDNNPEFVYKVVKKSIKNKFVSTTTGRFSVVYKLNLETFPHTRLPNSKIFVFEKLEYARIFINRDDNQTILKCKYSGKIQKPVCYTTYWYDEGYYDTYWNKDNVEGRRGNSGNPLPNGTCFADSVTPIEILTYTMR